MIERATFGGRRAGADGRVKGELSWSVAHHGERTRDKIHRSRQWNPAKIGRQTAFSGGTPVAGNQGLSVCRCGSNDRQLRPALPAIKEVIGAQRYAGSTLGLIFHEPEQEESSCWTERPTRHGDREAHQRSDGKGRFDKSLGGVYARNWDRSSSDAPCVNLAQAKATIHCCR